MKPRSTHLYWDMVRKCMPNYQEKIDWLKVTGAISVIASDNKNRTIGICKRIDLNLFQH